MPSLPDPTAAADALAALTKLRQHRKDGRRSPHKPLLVLLALGRLTTSGSSELPWSLAEQRLADLIAEFGPTSRTGRAQSAAYPFTRLRADGVWTLDHDVPMDLIGPLHAQDVVGRFSEPIELSLRRDPTLIARAAAALVDAEFPASVAPDVLLAAGLDPDLVLFNAGDAAAVRRRSSTWPREVLAAWDRQCAFCGFDGQLGGATIGVDAAHIRWFNFDGPDTLNNGLALCALHHRLLDRGALGLTAECRVQVSEHFSARTDSGKRVYDLHDQPLRPRPGTALPAEAHIAWHRTEVFQGQTLAA